MTDQNTNSNTSTTGDNAGTQGRLPKKDKRMFVLPPHPDTQFDEAYFLDLLEGSISLTLEEKKRVIDAIPRLSIEQIQELFAIFEEEREKFTELEKEYADDVAKLKREREKEQEIEEIYQQEEEEDSESDEEAEALRRRLRGEE
jgi:hypothetical protein